MRRRVEFWGQELVLNAIYSLRWLLIVPLVVASTGCDSPPAPQSSPPPTPTSLGEAREYRGRVFPNLVLHQDSEKGVEFWVKLEIGLDTLLKPPDFARIQAILLSEDPTEDMLGELEELITPSIHKNARPAFRQMIHCAIQDNVKGLAKCPDTWPGKPAEASGTAP